MSNPNPAPFLAALHAVFQSGPAAVALTEAELFLLANDACAPAERLSFEVYAAFKEALEAEAPTQAMQYAELYHEVYNLIKAESLKQKLYMLNAVAEGKPNWRRYCWLLEHKEKSERARNAAPRQKPVVSAQPQDTSLPEQAAAEPAVHTLAEEPTAPVAPEPTKTNRQDLGIRRPRRYSNRYQAPTANADTAPVPITTSHEEVSKFGNVSQVQRHMQRHMRHR